MDTVHEYASESHHKPMSKSEMTQNYDTSYDDILSLQCNFL